MKEAMPACCLTFLKHLNSLTTQNIRKTNFSFKGYQDKITSDYLILEHYIGEIFNLKFPIKENLTFSMSSRIGVS